MNRDEALGYVAHDCKCGKKHLVGWHYLAHLRFAHPVEYEAWITSRVDFGMSMKFHFGYAMEDEKRLPE